MIRRDPKFYNLILNFSDNDDIYEIRYGGGFEVFRLGRKTSQQLLVGIRYLIGCNWFSPGWAVKLSKRQPLALR